MAVVVGQVVHDKDYTFVNVEGETVDVKTGTWSVLSCPSGHVIEGDHEQGIDVGPCPECGM